MTRGTRTMMALAGLCLAGACSSPEPSKPPVPPVEGPVGTPTLVDASPSNGASSVPRTAWMALRFEGGVDPRALASFALECAGKTQAFETALLDAGTRLVVNPSSDLPDGANCTLSFRGPSSEEALSFSVASRGEPARVLYDRADSSRLSPWPDDALTVADDATRTGLRIAASPPGQGARRDLFQKALGPAMSLDGASPIGALVVELDASLDQKTLPMTPEASLDPLATMGLFDVDAHSPELGSRVPFVLKVDDRVSASGASSHVLELLPSHPLEPGRKYGLYVGRRALVDPTRPLDPSAAYAASFADPASSVGALSREVVTALETRASPPIHADDVALALRVTVRSLDDVPNDMLAIRAQIKAAPPPTFVITSVKPDADPNVAAVVLGTFQAPLFIDADGKLTRGNDGKPVSLASEPAPFALSIPKAALTKPVPAIMLQHGHVSDAPFIVSQIGKGELAPAGIAGIGFTDLQMRRPALVTLEYVFDGLLSVGRVPDYQTQSWAEQLAFLRLLPSFEASLDVVPLAADGTSTPDGKPDLDASAPLTFAGFSAGSFHGTGLLAYAPELRAASLAVGAGHWSAKTMHQKLDTVHDSLATKVPDLTRADVYLLFALGQAAFDAQDPLVHARFARRAQAIVGRGPSILLTEGIGDSLVPSVATRAAAWQLGLPIMERVAVSVPFLDVAKGPLTANLDSQTSGAFVQFVPVGIDGVAPTPACAATGETVGHFCADVSKAVGAARLGLFGSAFVDAIPTIEPVEN